MNKRNFTAHSVKIKYGRRRYANITIGGIYKTVHGYNVRVMGFIMSPEDATRFTIKSLVVDRWPSSNTKFEISAQDILPENNKESITIMESGATSIGKTDDGCEIYLSMDEYPMAVDKSVFRGGLVSDSNRNVH